MTETIWKNLLLKLRKTKAVSVNCVDVMRDNFSRCKFIYTDLHFPNNINSLENIFLLGSRFERSESLIKELIYGRNVSISFPTFEGTYLRHVKITTDRLQKVL